MYFTINPDELRHFPKERSGFTVGEFDHDSVIIRFPEGETLSFLKIASGTMYYANEHLASSDSLCIESVLKKYKIPYWRNQS